MKKIVLIIMTALSLLLSACATAKPPSKASEAPASEAPQAPTQNAPTASPGRYTVEGSVIYNENKDTVYDAAQYYDLSWTVWVDNVTEAYGALYFNEGAVVNDGISCICDAAQKGAAYAVVKLSLDGNTRQVLSSKTTPDGYFDVLPFADRVFFVDGSPERAIVGYTGKDGDNSGTVDLPAEQGESCINAKLDTDGDYLVITADFYSADMGVSSSHAYRVDTQLNVERMD